MLELRQAFGLGFASLVGISEHGAPVPGNIV